MSSFKKERALIRKRLQHQRQAILLQFSEQKTSKALSNTHLFEPGGTFPRSITMRLLTNRQNFVLMAVAELFPLLVRHFLKGSERQQEQSDDSG